jgi:hypothetical protein
MRLLTTLFCAQIVFLGFIPTAKAVVLTFDELPVTTPTTDHAPIPNGYGDLQWSNFSVLAANPRFTNNGYYTGTISAPTVAFNRAGNPAAFGSDTPFDFKSGYLTFTVTASNVMPVKIQGYVRSRLAYENDYLLTNRIPVFINFDYLGVNEVRFIPFLPHHICAMDNLTINFPGPPVISPTISCPAPITLECNNGAVATLVVGVADSGGNPLEVIWTVDGTPYQTNQIPFGGSVTSTNVTFSANFAYGEHIISVSASNGKTNAVSCSTSVTVQDTTDPQILSTAGIPGVLWPPNNQMVAVQVVVQGFDNCGPVTSKIIGVSSNEPESHNDWKITGDLSVNLRAKRFGNGNNRVYGILIECSDAVGNTSLRTVFVTVSHDNRPPKAN